MVKFESLSYIYAKDMPYATTAIEDIDLEIAKGKITAIIGKTGSGKSTLIQHLNALLLPTKGKLVIEDHVIEADKKATDLKALRKKVGLVFQFSEYQLFEETILKDVAFGPKNFGLSEEEAIKKAKEALKLVGLDETYYTRSPLDVSGGQKRRAAIAGILAIEPEIIVLDEPTAGLDPYVRNQLLNLLKKMQKSGVTILLVSHSMEEVANYADRVVVFNSGRICMDGSPEEVFADKEKIRKAGLEMPQVMEALWQLKEQGIPVHEFTCNEKTAICQIVDIIKKKEA